MNTLSILQSKRDEILALAAKHGASNVRLFGSVARGEDHEGSDVDFLVDMQVMIASRLPVLPGNLLCYSAAIATSSGG